MAVILIGHHHLGHHLLHLCAQTHFLLGHHQGQQQSQEKIPEIIENLRFVASLLILLIEFE